MILLKSLAEEAKGGIFVQARYGIQRQGFERKQGMRGSDPGHCGKLRHDRRSYLGGPVVFEATLSRRMLRLS